MASKQTNGSVCNESVTNCADMNASEIQPLLHPSDRMSPCQRASFGVGHVLNDICAALWFSYTLLFLQEVLGMPPILAGTLLMIGQVADAIATPIVGILSDRFGSRKVWHLGGSCLVILSFPLIFYTCPQCKVIPEMDSNSTIDLTDADLEPVFDWLLITSYVGLIIVFQIGWAVVQISHLSLIPDLRSSQRGRTELTAIRYTASVCSSVTVYVITWLVFHTLRNKDVMNTIGPDDAYKFRKIVIIGLSIGIACTVWFHAGLRKTRTALRLVTNPRKLRNITSYFRKPLLFQVASLYVASRLFLTISLVYIPLYLDEGLDEEAETLASVPLVSYIASFVSSLGIKYVNNYFGSKVSYLLGGILSILGCIWIGYGMNDEHISSAIYGIAILLGAGSSITTVTSLCITADLIGAETESGAFIYSIVTFADKLFTGFAVVIIEYLKCPSKTLCPHYYRDVLAYVCGASAILGLIVLATLTKVSLGNRNGEEVTVRFQEEKKAEHCPLISEQLESSIYFTDSDQR